MANVQRGTIAVAWSLVTSASATSPETAIGTGTVQSVDFTEESDEKAIKGADGATVCLVFSDQRQTCTIEVIPSSITSKALAKAANVLPDVGDTITLTDADDAEVAGTTWIFLGGSKRKSVDDNAVITMNLRKYPSDLALVS